MKQSRNTIAKTEIISLITKSDVALSHSEIQFMLDGLCDRVTIYRVLDRLVEEGYVHKVTTIDGVVKYASCNSCSANHNHSHIHFSCKKCKAVTCIVDVQPSFSLPSNYKISEVNFIISGLCPECS
ncbi:MAG: transcriptional repressor [Limnohabitans sp.]|nr:transcriptional repressor [Limnohabitans sp.]